MVHQWRNGRWVETSKVSNYEAAKSRVYHTSNPGGRKAPGRARLYQTCLDATCNGWEWCRNHATSCRKCGGPLSEPPPEWVGKGSQSGQSTPNASQASGTSLAEFLPVVEKLESEFPGIKQRVQAEFPKPELQPAEALHTAQQACQVAFKTLQSAESKVASLEKQCAYLSSQLRQKVSDLQNASTELLAAQKKHDVAAREAQLQVQNSKVCTDGNDGESEHLQQLVQKFSPEQLKKLAGNLSEAAVANESATSSHGVPLEHPKHPKTPPPADLLAPAKSAPAPTAKNDGDGAVTAEHKADRPEDTVKLEVPSSLSAGSHLPPSLPPANASADATMADVKEEEKDEAASAKRSSSSLPGSNVAEAKRSKSAASHSPTPSHDRSRSPVPTSPDPAASKSAAEHFAKVSKKLDKDLEKAVAKPAKTKQDKP